MHDILAQDQDRRPKTESNSHTSRCTGLFAGQSSLVLALSLRLSDASSLRTMTKDMNHEDDERKKKKESAEETSSNQHEQEGSSSSSPSPHGASSEEGSAEDAGRPQEKDTFKEKQEASTTIDKPHDTKKRTTVRAIQPGAIAVSNRSTTKATEKQERDSNPVDNTRVTTTAKTRATVSASKPGAVAVAATNKIDGSKVNPEGKKRRTAPASKPGAVSVPMDETKRDGPTSKKRVTAPAVNPGAITVDTTGTSVSEVSKVKEPGKKRATAPATRPGAVAMSAVSAESGTNVAEQSSAGTRKTRATEPARTPGASSVESSNTPRETGETKRVETDRAHAASQTSGSYTPNGSGMSVKKRVTGPAVKPGAIEVDTVNSAYDHPSSQQENGSRRSTDGSVAKEKRRPIARATQPGVTVLYGLDDMASATSKPETKSKPAITTTNVGSESRRHGGVPQSTPASLQRSPVARDKDCFQFRPDSTSLTASPGSPVSNKRRFRSIPSPRTQEKDAMSRGGRLARTVFVDDLPSTSIPGVEDSPELSPEQDERSLYPILTPLSMLNKQKISRLSMGPTPRLVQPRSAESKRAKFLKADLLEKTRTCSPGSPYSPKARFLITDSPEDVVMIDTGSWPVVSNVSSVSPALSGSSHSRVRVSPIRQQARSSSRPGALSLPYAPFSDKGPRSGKISQHEAAVEGEVPSTRIPGLPAEYESPESDVHLGSSLKPEWYSYSDKVEVKVSRGLSLATPTNHALSQSVDNSDRLANLKADYLTRYATPQVEEPSLDKRKADILGKRSLRGDSVGGGSKRNVGSPLDGLKSDVLAQRSLPKVGSLRHSISDDGCSDIESGARVEIMHLPLTDTNSEGEGCVSQRSPSAAPPGVEYGFDVLLTSESLAIAQPVDEVHEKKGIQAAEVYDPDKKPRFYERRRFQFAVVLGCLLAVAAIVGGAIAASRSGDGVAAVTEAPSMAPSMAPTSQRQARISEYIVEEFGPSVLDDESHMAAIDWISSSDALQREIFDPLFMQRYLMSLVWFRTSDNGRKPWLTCNPTTGMNSSTACQFLNFTSVDDNGSVSYSEDVSTRWLSDTDECEWAGVQCFQGNVAFVRMRANALVGQIPKELGRLPYLGFLFLSYNQLTGELPIEVVSLPNLLLLELQGTYPGGMSH